MKQLVTISQFPEADYFTREAYNSLRTNLRFCGAQIRSVLFTSCLPDEGKTTVVLELARSEAENGKRVLVIDADIRKSILVGRYDIKGEGELFGLSHYLSGQKKPDEILYRSNYEGLDLILAGPSSPNPATLLGSARFSELMEALKPQYDLILVDCPPLGMVIDAAVIAPQTDGVVLVVASGDVGSRLAEESKKQLELAKSRILGVVLNKVPTGRGNYGGYYKRYGKYSKYGKYGMGSTPMKEKIKRQKRSLASVLQKRGEEGRA